MTLFLLAAVALALRDFSFICLAAGSAGGCGALPRRLFLAFGPSASALLFSHALDRLLRLCSSPLSPASLSHWELIRIDRRTAAGPLDASTRPPADTKPKLISRGSDRKRVLLACCFLCAQQPAR